MKSSGSIGLSGIETSSLCRSKTFDYSSDNSSDFEEPLQVVDLTHGHGEENDSLEERPQNDTRVGTLVNGAMDAVSHTHILLLMFHSSQRRCQLLDHLLHLAVICSHKQLNLN